jgi:hypothetical protein
VKRWLDLVERWSKSGRLGWLKMVERRIEGLEYTQLGVGWLKLYTEISTETCTSFYLLECSFSRFPHSLNTNTIIYN